MARFDTAVEKGEAPVAVTVKTQHRHCAVDRLLKGLGNFNR